MKFTKKIYVSNLTFLILPLLLITVTIYVVGIDVFNTQMHERNLLYLDQIAARSESLLDLHTSGDQVPSLEDLELMDGVALIVDLRNNLRSGTVSASNVPDFTRFIAAVDWIKGEQGHQYILGTTKYYLYHCPLGNGLFLLYFRPKNVSNAMLARFNRALLAAFACLILSFYYFQKNSLRRMVKPLEELIKMVQSLTFQQNNGTIPALRSMNEDEIALIKTYVAELQESLRDRDSRLRRNLFSVMDVLIGLLEIKDSYTASHSKQVRKYSIAIAQMIGLAEQEVRDIAFAATLHDIGKIGVSHTILNKPGKLTAQEFALIKQHPVVADEVLKNIEELDYIRNIIRHHHEKYDGTGYPDNLQGEEIPLAARVVSVADAFDAMTSDRPYRKALYFKDALDILVNEKGRQFDPRVVDALVKYIYRQNLFDESAAASKE